MSTGDPRVINLDDPPKGNGNTGTTGTPDTDTGPGTAPPRTGPQSKLETQLHDFYAQLGTYLGLMMPEPFVGMMIAGNAEAAASAWTDLAAQDPAVKRAIERILSGGAWANVIGIHAAGIVLPILAFYGRLPDQASAILLMGIARSNPELAPVIQARMERNGGGQS